MDIFLSNYSYKISSFSLKIEDNWFKHVYDMNKEYMCTGTDLIRIPICKPKDRSKFVLDSDDNNRVSVEKTITVVYIRLPHHSIHMRKRLKQEEEF